MLMVFPEIHAATCSADSGTEADDERHATLHAISSHPRGLSSPALATLPLNCGLGPKRETSARSLSQDYPSDTVNANNGAQLREQEIRHHAILEPLTSPGQLLHRQRCLRSSFDGTWDARQPTGDKMRQALSKFFQRVAETVVMLAIGMTVVVGNKDVIEALSGWRRELSTFFTLLSISYLTFPLRISASVLYRSRWRPIILFPFTSRFDAAPLIYPVFVPVLIALSLAPASSSYILPNIILALSSLPPAIVPFNHASITPFDPLHWLVTVLPYVPSEYLSLHSAEYLPLSLRGFEPELLYFLYPLHRSLCSLLYGLVTTSLLPSELNLLATAMINLYLFAQSPQMQIFKGASLFCLFLFLVLCGDVLHAIASLAQIPKWKFRRRTLRKNTTYRDFLKQLDQRVCEALVGAPRRLSECEHEAIESDFYAPIRTHQCQQQVRSCNSDRAPESPPSEEGTCSPVKMTSRGRRRKVLPPELAEFASLTTAQAQVRKYVCSAYIYVVGVFIGLVPCRIYIRDMALGGHDPFLWAYSYLFEEVFSPQQWKEWLTFPGRGSQFQMPGVISGGWVEHQRRNIVGEANTRLIMSGYFAILIASSLILILRAQNIDTDTRRKVFHGMMVSMLLPTTFIDPIFIALAFIVVLNVLFILDIFRASHVPPIARPIDSFLAPYVDTRDRRGPVVVSHMYLLIGCAIPLWLSLAATPRSADPESHWPGWDVATRDLSMVSGVICVGMGDAAASLVGRRWGRRKWFFSRKKSIEGSVTFAFAVFVGLNIARAWLVVGGWNLPPNDRPAVNFRGTMAVLWKTFVAASGSSIMEALLTGGNDNVVIPLILWLLVKGLRI